MAIKGISVPQWAVVPIIGALIALGTAKAVLANKEDKSAHDHDHLATMDTIHGVRSAVLDTLHAIGTRQELNFVRDSAWRADVKRSLHEEECTHHPNRATCQ